MKGEYFNMMKKWTAIILALLLMLPAMSFAEDKVLNILSWEGYVDADTIAAFETETGIKVIWSPMDSIDSMLLKVTQGGGSDYDLILSSDYSLDILRQQGYLQKLDLSKLNNYANLNESFLNQKYDPANEYVIPYMAGATLIIYDPALVSFDIKGYSDLWNAELKGSIAALENARVLCGMVLKTMGKSMNETDEAVLAEMKDKMMPLYQNIYSFGDQETYTTLVSGETSVAFTYAAFAHLLLQDRPDLQVVYPEEGLGFGVDGFVIPDGAKNSDNAHAFLDYLMRPEVAAHNAEYQGYMCVNKAAEPYLSEAFFASPAMNIPADNLATAEFVESVGAVETLFQEIYTAFKNQ